MQILKVAALVALALGLGGCGRLLSVPPNAPTVYGVPVNGPAQAALAFYAGPADTGPSSKASKRGESCAQNILGLVAWGDASIDAAKRAGGITEVASVEQLPVRVLTYYGRYCTVVRGE